MKKLKGQQLVEFALSLPIFVILIVIIIEVGMAINTRLTLSEAVKMSLVQANELYNYPGTKANKTAFLQANIQASMQDYFTLHNIPFADTVMVTVNNVAGTDVSEVQASYDYIPSFTLPNLFGGSVIPNSYTFTSSQLINQKYLEENVFNRTLTTKDLSAFGKDSAALDAKPSILISPIVDYGNNKTFDLKPQIAFLVGMGTEFDYAKIFNWWGEDMLPQNMMVDLTTGYMAVNNPYNLNGWELTSIPVTHILSSMGFTHGIYAKMDNLNSVVNMTKLRLLLSSDDERLNKDIFWCGQSECAWCGVCENDDYSDQSIDNLPKRALSFLFNTTSGPYGTVDTVKSNTGNQTIETMKTYLYTDNNNYTLTLTIPIDLATTYPPEPTHTTSVVDYYLDSDGDGIPNSHDQNPTCPDINADGIPDGQNTSIKNVDELPATFQQILSADKINYTYIKPLYPDTTDATVPIPTPLYLPVTLDGTLSATTHPNVPNYQFVNIYLVGVDDAGLSAQPSVTTHEVIMYEKTNGDLIRVLPATITTAQKNNFIHGTTTGIDMSAELDFLENNSGPFSDRMD